MAERSADTAMDAAESDELRTAYQKHRTARAWMFFAAPLVMTLTQAGLAVVIAWMPTTPEGGRIIGVVGGVVGTIVGVAGAAAGIYFGFWAISMGNGLKRLLF